MVLVGSIYDSNEYNRSSLALQLPAFEGMSAILFYYLLAVY